MSMAGRWSAALVMLSLLALGAALWLGPTPLADPFAPDEGTRVIVWEIRLPRALTAWLVGAALGISGAALQGLLRNPLADPGVLGLSGFAALGAVLAFAMGFATLAPAMAIAFALCAALLVAALGWGARGPASLVLIGVGLSSLAGGAWRRRLHGRGDRCGGRHRLRRHCSAASGAGFRRPRSGTLALAECVGWRRLARER